MKKLLSVLCVPLCVASVDAVANGITINEQSVSAMGTAYAGRASSALDASTVFGNPAGMSKLKRAEVSGGLTLISAKTDISDTESNRNPGTNKGDMVPLSGVPFGYYVTPLDDRWHFGIGLYAPTGIIGDYESSFQGRSHASFSKVVMVTLQPTLSYKFNDRFSIGFGPTISRVTGQLKSELNTSALNRRLGGSGEMGVDVKGDDTTFGYNIGMMWDLSEDLTWGLTYHSKTKINIKGRTEIKNSPGGMFDNRYGAKIDITLPEVIDSSLTYRLNDRWTLHGGAAWTRWSRLETVKVVNDAPASSPFAISEEPLNWENTWSYSLGASYQLDKQWVFRAGYAYDASPTNNAKRNVRIPVSNRKIFAVGAGWSPNDDTTIDVALAYIQESAGRVDAESRELSGIQIQPAYSAKFKSSAIGLGTQFTYRF
ncbi:TonB-dependent receptor [Pseudomonas sp. 25 R 14]|uniref:OmpP1/FadL family transporter n=1 Tax=Pseudomonas sp. 25 R 14 TaxID=1844109 RepID=UPI0008126C2F|nr:TonB-dependent receptor [Pseudomonas sp. 25 R 14]CRM75786.1 Outer membrane flp protein [Pseudomonas sp. 25 R 14]